MSQRHIIALLLSAVAIHAVEAKDQALLPADIAKIKHICRQIIGNPVATEHNLWSQLTPFLRSKSELDHLIVDCSSQHCSGSIRLLDDAEVLYTSVMCGQSTAKLDPTILHRILNTGEITGSLEWRS
jgi:hypothetical protein